MTTSTTQDAAWWLQPLDDLTAQQWEALCDGCGQCCHQKYEDEDSGELYLTNIACRLFDSETCQCSAYSKRQQQVPDCLSIREMSREQYAWLPPSCAYRLRANNQPLADWHPLCSGNPDSIHQAEISMRGRSIPDEDDSNE